MPPEARVDALRAQLPQGGLFAGMDWLWSPDPYLLDARQWKFLEGLGHKLSKFLSACDGIYRRSVRQSLPSWVHQLLDAGKPAWLIDEGLAGPRGALPRVIRPDLIVTADGFALTEIDSVPGGIGLLDWLNVRFADFGFPVVGGGNGMRDGFRSVFGPGGADILVSREAGAYRPEMEWLASRLREQGARFEVHDAEDYQPGDRSVYRFFELFDWENLPSFRPLLQAWRRGALDMCSPPVPWLEEKAWLALLWSAPLRETWDLALRRSVREDLQALVPFGWTIDPHPLPHHGVLPRLEAHSWGEVAHFSQKQRELVLKVSGFHPDAWGARSVIVGHDVAQSVWADALIRAARAFSDSPWVLQEFKHARTRPHRFVDARGKLVTAPMKARLTPYYFVDLSGQTRLGGVHATLCPADKKILHGMRDAIMVPCAPESG